MEHVRIGEGHRAQLGLPAGAAELIVAEVRPGRRVPTADRSHQVMLKVEDAAAVLARATGRGALETDPLRDWEYGERQAAFTDPFGHQWALTQTLVDTAPEQWGGHDDHAARAPSRRPDRIGRRTRIKSAGPSAVAVLRG